MRKSVYIFSVALLIRLCGTPVYAQEPQSSFNDLQRTETGKTPNAERLRATHKFALCLTLETCRTPREARRTAATVYGGEASERTHDAADVRELPTQVKPTPSPLTQNVNHSFAKFGINAKLVKSLDALQTLNNTQSSTPSPPQTATGAPPPSIVLTPQEKLRYGLRQAYFTSGAYIGPAFGAGIRRLREVDVPTKSSADKFADYLSDYARVFATGSTTELFGAGIYPALFKQNPKYTKLKDISNGRANRRARLLYAIANTVVTTGDDGTRQINYSRLSGNLTGATLANIWERDTPRERNEFGITTEVIRRRGAGATLRRFGLSLGFDALTNIAEEFLSLGR